jgi:hypothetical protein
VLVGVREKTTTNAPLFFPTLLLSLTFPLSKINSNDSLGNDDAHSFRQSARKSYLKKEEEEEEEEEHSPSLSCCWLLVMCVPSLSILRARLLSQERTRSPLTSSLLHLSATRRIKQLQPHQRCDDVVLVDPQQALHRLLLLSLDRGFVSALEGKRNSGARSAMKKLPSETNKEREREKQEQ